MRRAIILGYGAVAYALGMASLLYLVGFLAGRGVPKGVDDGTLVNPWLAAAADLGLVLLFGAQHSVMARPWFKQRWTRLVPPTVERSTYVLTSGLTLALVLWLWLPLPAVVWSVPDGWGRTALWFTYLLGWAVLVVSTFIIGHFDLFGLRQVLAAARGTAYVEPTFREPPLYRSVRHPMMVGFLIAFWAAPDLSVGRLIWALLATAVIVVGARLEERDLTRDLGDAYARYLDRVPRFIPRPRLIDQRRRDRAGATG
jgi:methanethiol S-methyltransferase